MTIEVTDSKLLKSEDAIYKGAAAIGDKSVSDLSVFVVFATYCYSVGLAIIANKLNVAIDKAKLFAAFNDAFRAKSFRVALKEKSIKTWVSSFGQFVDAGQFKAYDLMPYIEKIYAMPSDVSFTSRASKLRKIMSKHTTTPPTAEELDKIMNPKSEEDTNPLGSLANRLVGQLSEKSMAKSVANKDALMQSHDNKAQRAALIEVRIALDKLAAACKELEAGESGLTSAEELAMLRGDDNKPNGAAPS